MSAPLAAYLFTQSAHAGWLWDRICQHLIAVDPYQYEQTDQRWLERELYRLTVRIRNGVADRFEREEAEIIARELRNRELLRRGDDRG